MMIEFQFKRFKYFKAILFKDKKGVCKEDLAQDLQTVGDLLVARVYFVGQKKKRI